MTRLRSMGALWPPGSHDDDFQAEVCCTEDVQRLPATLAQRQEIERLLARRDALKAELTSVEERLGELDVEMA